MFGSKKNKRFKNISEESSEMVVKRIVQDKETGVNYLFISSNYAGGVTPLLDSDGKPIVTHVVED